MPKKEESTQKNNSPTEYEIIINALASQKNKPNYNTLKTSDGNALIDSLLKKNDKGRNIFHEDALTSYFNINNIQASANSTGNLFKFVRSYELPIKNSTNEVLDRKNYLREKYNLELEDKSEQNWLLKQLLTAKDNEGKTPLELAIEKGNWRKAAEYIDLANKAGIIDYVIEDMSKQGKDLASITKVSLEKNIKFYDGQETELSQDYLDRIFSKVKDIKAVQETLAKIDTVNIDKTLEAKKLEAKEIREQEKKSKVESKGVITSEIAQAARDASPNAAGGMTALERLRSQRSTATQPRLNTPPVQGKDKPPVHPSYKGGKGDKGRG